jgi:hypothetical protein
MIRNLKKTNNRPTKSKDTWEGDRRPGEWGGVN